MERRSRAEMIAETRAKLIAAARSAFGTKGYADTSMDDLTATVGLTRGAIYHHFGGKEGLLEAVVVAISDEMKVHYEQAFTDAGGGWAGLHACCLTFLRLALEPEVQRIVLRDAPAVLGERWRAIDSESAIVPMSETLEQLMAEGSLTRADPEALARLINGGLVDTALWIAKAPDPPACLERATAAFTALLEGLRRSGATRA